MTTRGICWLAECEWHFGVTFAHGLTAEELAVRLGATPGSRPSVTADAAIMLLTDADVGVARIGEAGGWAFAVEYGESRGTRHDVLKMVSRGGVTAVNLDPQAFHPPPMFSCAVDDDLVCSFGLGEEWRRWGSEPDLLQEDLEDAGVILPGGQYLETSGDRHSRRIALSLGVVEKRFSLSLPRDQVLDGALPLAVISGRPSLDTLDF
ncbi:DUF6461 domain-containing protein [Streptomyces sp. SID4982]|uniref:DUF6461 domain-containing protein n=1 Tax=Streptomyces sp. SID4982 TaxID=2690291 RepID=UPI00136E7029|nr:DUF6461 domain-containing protein [Streptomyces sp. SID4982]MYS17860.1 hypothetical protein [Streptomyces sp. SID4982]